MIYLTEHALDRPQIHARYLLGSKWLMLAYKSSERKRRTLAASVLIVVGMPYV